MKWLPFGIRERNGHRADDPMVEMSMELRVLYRHYMSRAKRLRWVAYGFMSVTCILLLTIAGFAGSVVFIPDLLNVSDKFFKQFFEDVKEAQSINHPPGPQDINDVAINAVTETSVAVGNDGVILRTDNQGKSWTHVDSGTRDDLNVVAFSTDGDTALVGGNGGVVLLSTDDGQSWQRPEGDTYTNKAFYDVALSSNGRIAAAVGRRGLIRISRDRGNSWIDPGNVAAKNLNGVVLSRDGKTVVVAGDDGTIRVAATDQAEKTETWIRIKVDEPKKDFEALALGGERGETVVAVGDDGLIWSSTDLEKKWKKWNSLGKEKRSDNFKAIAFSGDGGIAMAVGSRGRIWVFKDSGQTWDSKESNVGDRLEAISLSHDGTIAVAAGRDGTIVVSTDQGRTWTSPGNRTAKRLYSLALSSNGKWATAVGRDATLLQLSSIGKNRRPEVVVTTFTTVSETAMEKDPGPQELSNLDYTDVFHTSLYYRGLFWPIGSILIVMFTVRYLILLTKYYLRLSGFYYARGDAILLCDSKALPHPATIDELDQLIRALSPEELEFERTPRNLMKQALGMVGHSFRERKSSKIQSGDG